MTSRDRQSNAPEPVERQRLEDGASAGFLDAIAAERLALAKETIRRQRSGRAWSGRQDRRPHGRAGAGGRPGGGR